MVNALTGDFVAPGKVLAYARAEADGGSEVDYGPVVQAFRESHDSGRGFGRGA